MVPFPVYFISKRETTCVQPDIASLIIFSEHPRSCKAAALHLEPLILVQTYTHTVSVDGGGVARSLIDLRPKIYRFAERFACARMDTMVIFRRFSKSIFCPKKRLRSASETVQTGLGSQSCVESPRGQYKVIFRHDLEATWLTEKSDAKMIRQAKK